MLPLLSFHRTVLEDIHDPTTNDLLVIARGLGLRRIVCNLLKLYDSPQNLVLLVNATPEEEVAVESAVASVVASRRPSVASTDGALPEPPRTPQIPEPPRTPQIQAAMAEEPEADVDVSPSSSSQAPPKIRHKTSYSVQSLDPPKVRSEKDWSSRLSLSIPGSFF